MVDFERTRVTAADFNGRDWDGSPFDPFPDWMLDALERGDVRVSDGGHCTDYAVWKVKGCGEAWPGDYISRTAEGAYSIQKAERT